MPEYLLSPVTTTDTLVSASGDLLCLPFIDATGSPTLPKLTASGVAKRKWAGSGTPTLPKLTASGAEKAYRKTTSAVLFTGLLTAVGGAGLQWNAVGEVTFPRMVTHPEASGALTLGQLMEAFGSGKSGRKAAGNAPELPVMSAAGAGVRKIKATGIPNILNPTVAGEAMRQPILREAAGDIMLGMPTLVGGVVKYVTASGSASLPMMRVTNMGVKRAFGAPALPRVQASGVADLDHFLVISLTLPKLSAPNSLAVRVIKAAGELNTRPLASTAVGLVRRRRTASGEPTLPAARIVGSGRWVHPPITATSELVAPKLRAAGVSTIKRKRLASGEPTLPTLRAAGLERRKAFALGAPVLPMIDVSGGSVMGYPAVGLATLAPLTADGHIRRRVKATGNVLLNSTWAFDVDVTVNPDVEVEGIISLPMAEVAGAVRRAIRGNGQVSLPRFNTTVYLKRSVPVTATATLPGLVVVGGARNPENDDVQIYRVKSLKTIPGKPWRIAILEPTKRPMDL